MLEELIGNEHFRRIFPPLAAVGFVVLFAALGLWQLDRAAEKNRVRALFENDAPVARLTRDMPVMEFQSIETYGYYHNNRQVLIDNMLLDGRIGYYAITAFRFAEDEPLLIVNRGWIARSNMDDSDEPDSDIRVDDDDRSIYGRVGYLPRVGVRPKDAFAGERDWPKTALYPTLEELSAELGEDLLPFILLLDPQADDGYVRRWQPRDSGPMMHYGYAFQWFAMTAAIVGIFTWRIRKKWS